MSVKTVVALGASLALVGVVLTNQWNLAVAIFCAYVGWTLIRTPNRRRGGMPR